MANILLKQTIFYVVHSSDETSFGTEYMLQIHGGPLLLGRYYTFITFNNRNTINIILQQTWTVTSR